MSAFSRQASLPLTRLQRLVINPANRTWIVHDRREKRRGIFHRSVMSMAAACASISFAIYEDVRHRTEVRRAATTRLASARTAHASNGSKSLYVAAVPAFVSSVRARAMAASEVSDAPSAIRRASSPDARCSCKSVVRSSYTSNSKPLRE